MQIHRKLSFMPTEQTYQLQTIQQAQANYHSYYSFQMRQYGYRRQITSSQI